MRNPVGGETPSRAAQLAAEADTDPVGPLWRGAQLFRAVSYCYALGFQIAINGDLARPTVTWVLFALLTAWTLACGIGYFAGFARNRYWVIAEVIIAAAMMLSTSYVAEADWILNNQSWPTTLWATNAVISAALLAGPWWGIVAGLFIGGTSIFVKGDISFDFGRNATIIVIVATGMAVGLAAVIARRAQIALARAARLAAATEERERLSREVHDGVLQTLALISKGGREIGGATTQLAELAGEQERALRALIADTGGEIGGAAGDSVGGQSVDLAAALRTLVADDVSVSAPGGAVIVDAAEADEIRAAVRNAVENTRQHAGTGAKSFVLLEDLGSEVIVTVRDDGVGIPEGRLEQARSQGRMGVSKSIIGRIEALGGRTEIYTGPGEGTEWELTIPTGTVAVANSAAAAKGVSAAKDVSAAEQKEAG